MTKQEKTALNIAKFIQN
ncbi:Rop family plasmid primer RNA-binding protein, partial [Klebsiella quasipneumoniae]